METSRPSNTLKITINPDVNTTLSINGWPINTGNKDPLDFEPERVDIERGRLSYSLVFTSDGPKLEIWDVDESGELAGLKTSIDLPNYHALI